MEHFLFVRFWAGFRRNSKSDIPPPHERFNHLDDSELRTALDGLLEECRAKYGDNPELPKDKPFRWRGWTSEYRNDLWTAYGKKTMGDIKQEARLLEVPIEDLSAREMVRAVFSAIEERHRESAEFGHTRKLEREREQWNQRYHPLSGYMRIAGWGTSLYLEACPRQIHSPRYFLLRCQDRQTARRLAEALTIQYSAGHTAPPKWRPALEALLPVFGVIPVSGLSDAEVTAIDLGIRTLTTTQQPIPFGPFAVHLATEAAAAKAMQVPNNVQGQAAEALGAGNTPPKVPAARTTPVRKHDDLLTSYQAAGIYTELMGLDRRYDTSNMQKKFGKTIPSADGKHITYRDLMAYCISRREKEQPGSRNGDLAAPPFCERCLEAGKKTSAFYPKRKPKYCVECCRDQKMFGF